jgi:hypothetical protein
MATTRFTISLPDPLANAIVGEAVRSSARTSEVTADALVELFPDFVAHRMRSDLDAGDRPLVEP